MSTIERLIKRSKPEQAYGCHAVDQGLSVHFHRDAFSESEQ